MNLHVLKVFNGEDGSGGNPLGVFLDGAGMSASRRQRIAADLAFSETVFVEDRARGVVHIHTPTEALPLAGHPLVGTSWLLAQQGTPVATLRPPAGDVATWREGGLTWIRARPEWAPAYELRRLDSPADVEAFGDVADDAMLAVWAWLDEAAGVVRSRVFPRGIGIEEDEATGAAAIGLGAALGRPLTIRQGVGSMLAVRPGPEGTIEVGGRSELVEQRVYGAVAA